LDIESNDEDMAEACRARRRKHKSDERYDKRKAKRNLGRPRNRLQYNNKWPFRK
jgi:hypothetical protein